MQKVYKHDFLFPRFNFVQAYVRNVKAILFFTKDSVFQLINGHVI